MLLPTCRLDADTKPPFSLWCAQIMVGLPRALLTTVVYAVALLRTCFSACGSALHRGAQPQRLEQGDTSRTKRNEV